MPRLYKCLSTSAGVPKCSYRVLQHRPAVWSRSSCRCSHRNVVAFAEGVKEPPRPTGGTVVRKKGYWEPVLQPAALLSKVAVVVVSPRRGGTVGVVARACAAFECEDLRIVLPRCDYRQRAAVNVSKGAAYLLHRQPSYDSLPAALADCTCSVAFARWPDSSGQPALRSVAELLQHPPVQEILTGGVSGRVALVFGREYEGLEDGEIAACSATCSIPIGRLQESLSVSHAVSLALSGMFEARLASIPPQERAPYLTGSLRDLCAGFDPDAGKER